MLINGYGKQFGIIAFGGGLNARHAVNEYLARGFVVIWCGDYARIHEAR